MTTFTGGKKERNGVEELVMKALRGWEGDMLKHLRNRQKKKDAFTARMEGVLDFHHISLLAGVAATELSDLRSPPIFLQTAQKEQPPPFLLLP